MQRIGIRFHAPILALAVLAAAPAAALDEDLFAALLAVHTRPVDDLAGTRVDYAALRGSADWKRLVQSVDRTDPAMLASREGRLAFWINAYNILAIDLVRRHYPVESIRDIGSFLSPVWKKPAGRAAGREVTLHEIEHEILRPMGDPRIHAALVCASTSCPALRRDPYTAAEIDAQLDDTVDRWLANPRKGLRIDRAGRTVHLSRIFDWFQEDFEARGGVLAFAAAHAPRAERAWLERHGSDAELVYMDYDWSLNGL
jgi:hypothetical protein